jgi:hypothetical protein
MGATGTAGARQRYDWILSRFNQAMLVVVTDRSVEHHFSPRHADRVRLTDERVEALYDGHWHDIAGCKLAATGWTRSACRPNRDAELSPAQIQALRALYKQATGPDGTGPLPNNALDSYDGRTVNSLFRRGLIEATGSDFGRFRLTDLGRAFMRAE